MQTFTITPKKTFKIDMKSSGRSRWYVARFPLPEGRFEVYTSNDLNYLKRKVKSMGHDFVVNFW